MYKKIDVRGMGPDEREAIAVAFGFDKEEWMRKSHSLNKVEVLWIKTGPSPHDRRLTHSTYAYAFDPEAIQGEWVDVKFTTKIIATIQPPPPQTIEKDGYIYRLEGKAPIN